MKSFLIAIIFFGLGFGGFWAYNKYQSLLVENEKLRAATKQVPSTASFEGVTPTSEPGATVAPDATGKIQGVLSYPAEVIPPLEVYAIKTSDAAKFYKIKTEKNQTEFTFESVDPGSYYVVAYSVNYGNLPGAYSKAVPCGLSVICTDHKLIAVSVNPGGINKDAQVKDWYAPDGTFPAKPE